MCVGWLGVWLSVEDCLVVGWDSATDAEVDCAGEYVGDSEVRVWAVAELVTAEYDLVVDYW